MFVFLSWILSIILLNRLILGYKVINIKIKNQDIYEQMFIKYFDFNLNKKGQTGFFAELYLLITSYLKMVLALKERLFQHLEKTLKKFILVNLKLNYHEIEICFLSVNHYRSDFLFEIQKITGG